jgi:undecaprenyl-diphosphatase
MNVLQALILGFIQGFSEFIPISSSGHLVLAPRIFHFFMDQPLSFDVVLHLGTLAALVVYFYQDLKDILFSVIGDWKKLGLPKVKKIKLSDLSENTILLCKIAIGSIPAGIVGVLFDKFFETTFRGVTYVVIFVTVGSLLMLGAEFFIRFFKKKLEVSNKTISSLSFKDSFLIGAFQTLALFPGVSRSGSTISGGLYLGLNREDAAKFSFLLSIPIIGLAGLFKLVTSFNELRALSFGAIALGFLFSFVVGLFAITFLIKYLKKHDLYLFIGYRVLLALSLVLFLL